MDVGVRFEKEADIHEVESASKLFFTDVKDPQFPFPADTFL